MRSTVQTRQSIGKHRKFSPGAVKKQPVSATRFNLPRVTRRIYSEAERRLFFELCPVEGAVKWDDLTREYNFRVGEALRQSQGSSNIGITDLFLKQKKHLVEFARGIVEQQVVDASLGWSAESCTRFQVLQHDLHNKRSPLKPPTTATQPFAAPSSGVKGASASIPPSAVPQQTPQGLAAGVASPLISGLSQGSQQPFAFMRQPPTKPVARLPRGIASRGVERRCRLCGLPIKGLHNLRKPCPYV